MRQRQLQPPPAAAGATPAVFLCAACQVMVARVATIVRSFDGGSGGACCQCCETHCACRDAGGHPVRVITQLPVADRRYGALGHVRALIAGLPGGGKQLSQAGFMSQHCAAYPLPSWLALPPRGGVIDDVIHMAVPALAL
jgi:hypothetical protein